MIIVMKKNATEAETDNVISWIESIGYKAHPSRGVERTIIGAVGDERGKKPAEVCGASARRGEDSPHSQALQAGKPGVQGFGHYRTGGRQSRSAAPISS